MALAPIKTAAIKSSYLIFRAFSISTVNAVKQWRIDRGLPVNKNSEGILTDGPDYSFLDGRPTPLLHKQKLRMLKQQNIASKIVQLSSEIDFALERDKKLKQSKKEERQRIINNRLKPKGQQLYTKQ